MAISQAIVTAYCDTGFNSVNRPDSPALLATAASKVVELSVLNCLPLSSAVTSITVKSFDGLTKLDYVKMVFPLDNTTYFGIVTGYNYVSLDTVVIDIVMDGTLTCKASASGITGITGYTSRVHIPKSDDVMCKYTEYDPYLSCTEPLQLKTEKMFIDGTYSSDEGQVITAAVVDLNLLGKEDYEGAITFSDQNDNVVTVPKIPGVKTDYNESYNTKNYKEKIVMHLPRFDEESGTPILEEKEIESPAVHYFDGENDDVINGIARLHALGGDSAVIAQYIIPKAYISVGIHTPLYFGRINGYEDVPGEFRLVGDGKFSLINNDDFKFDYTEVQNKRLLSGDINKYGMISTGTGSSAEFNPEDLIKSVDNPLDKPYVFVFVDPRENGKPYFRFVYVNGDFDNFFRGLVVGGEWRNAPITYFQASGYETQIMKFNNNSKIMENNIDRQMWNGVNNAIASAFGGSISSESSNVSKSYSDNYSNYIDNQKTYSSKKWAQAGMPPIQYGNTSSSTYSQSGDYSQATSGGSTNLRFNVLGAAAGAFGAAANGAVNTIYAQKQRELEMQNLGLDIFTVAPSMDFPINNCLKDFVGNGIIVYRYRPTDGDLARLDKILNAFGYKHSKILELSDFTNRSRYNYVEASGVSIKCSAVPKFIREIAEAELSLGIRFWHIRPDYDYTIENS